MNYTVLIEEGPTNFGAYIPDLPGCVAVGGTREEAVTLIRGEIRHHLEELCETGASIPQPITTVEIVNVEHPIRVMTDEWQFQEPAQEKEKCVNIFAYGDEDFVHSVGYCTYFLEGDYAELTNFLRSRVHLDHQSTTQIPLHKLTSWENFNATCRLGDLNDLLVGGEMVPEDIVYCITAIINGNVKIEEVVDYDTFPDYLLIYLTEEGLDLTSLINDDHVEPARILWQQRKFISSLKLYFSMIDTLGFIEFGPVSNAFTRWLDEYCELEELDVTSAELWELRNSLLHMTNYSSRKVERGYVKRLLPVVTALINDISPALESTKTLHSTRFVAHTVPNGIGKWLESYNKRPEKFLDFVNRYDTVASEARLSVVQKLE